MLRHVQRSDRGRLAGSTKLAWSTQPADLTDAMIADTTVSRVGDDTLIGTEWGASGFGGISNG